MRPQMLNLDKIMCVNFMSKDLTECVHFMLRVHLRRILRRSVEVEVFTSWVIGL